MQTTQLYYENPYSAQTEAEIITVESKGANSVVVLDRTVAYAEGGGQSSDQGEIIGPHGRMRFNLVQLREGRIVHQGRMDGVLSAGETVQMQIKWGHRHNGMRVHSAGHALHDAVMTLKPEGIIPIKAMHGHDAFVEYSGDWLEANPREIEDGVNALVHANLPVAMRATTLAEIEANCRFVPHGLPRNKPLRVVQIGDGQAVPCGGVHVRELGEIGKVIVVDVCRNRDTANLRIRYRVTKGDA